MTVHLAFLGTGTCSATGRNPQSLAFSEGASVVLMDAGGGCYQQMARMGLPHLDPRRIDAIILTHYHMDHVSGIPDILWGEMWDDRNKRTRPLTIAGPPGLHAFMETRLLPFMGDHEMAFPLVARELLPGETHDFGLMNVEPVPLAHSETSTGYRVTLEGITFAVTGDTGYCDSLPGFLRGADAAVIEWSFGDDRESPKHLAAPDILRLLKEDALPEKVYVCHIYPVAGMEFHEQVKRLKNLLGEEARRFVFPGDGHVVRIS